MNSLNILFISGSLGLGHIGRDIAIANQLRTIYPDCNIEWLAANPATSKLVESGEKLVEEIEQYSNENESAEKAAEGASLNILKYLMNSKDEWKNNVKFFFKLIEKNKYDLVIGDETYEIAIGLGKFPEMKKFPFVMIYDFVGLDAMTKNPLEHLGIYYFNRLWSADYRLKRNPSYDLGLFVGELNDVPDKTFGFLLPNRRKYAKDCYTFLGYIFPFDTKKYQNNKEIKEKLGYKNEPLVICSIGGTSIGKELLELCAKAYTIAKKEINNLNLVLVTGPRLSAKSLKIPEGIVVKEYIPNLFEHFAASDLAIVQGGATSTLELSALRRPFIYFPLEGHCEQANVARILTERGAGQRMKLSTTSSLQLAEKMVATLGKKVTYPEIPVDGAHKAAKEIACLMEVR